MTRHHAPPETSDIFRAQLSLVAAPPHVGVTVALVLVLAQAVALAAAGMVFGIAITPGNGTTTVELGASLADLTEEEGFAPVDEGLAALLFAAGASALWGFFFPFRVWRGEVPSRRGYHWAMPVEHRAHDLLRVAAGAVWLEVIVVTVLLTAAGTAFAFGHSGELAGLSAWVWGSALLGPLLLYLAVSIPVVRCEHPAAWVWGSLGFLALLWTLLAAAAPGGLRSLCAEVLLGRFGLLTALAGPVLGETYAEMTTGPPWLVAWLLWGAVAAAGLWRAARGRRRRG